MKEYRRIYNRIKNKNGFTLAELLVVVAIIGVLVAVSMPIFTKQLEKSRESTDFATMQAAKAAAVAAYYKSANVKDWEDQDRFYYDITTGKIVESTGSGVPDAYGKGTTKVGYTKDALQYYDPCEDKNYDPETDYTDKIIVAYVDGTTMHVHWVDGSNAGSYTPSAKSDDDDDDEDDTIPSAKEDDDDDDDSKESEDPSYVKDGGWPTSDQANSLKEGKDFYEYYETTLIKGGKYEWDGKTYICKIEGTLDLNGYNWGYPGTSHDNVYNWFVELKDDPPTIYGTSSTQLNDLEEGTVFVASDGVTKYIYHGGTGPVPNPEKYPNDTNWTKIVDTTSSWSIVTKPRK